MTSEAPGIPCPACQAMNAPGGRFCSQCAAPLEAAGASGEVGERKQVSVLFSDLTGYTTLSERLDPEETREIMGRIFGRAAEIVGRYEGRIEKFIGDAVMAIFGAPEAHEDDPVRAVAAALELHQAVAEMAPEIEARTEAAVALHSGINTGMVVTGELRFGAGSAGPVGDTINTAARLMGLAPTGEIWIGPLTQRLTAGRVETEDLGAQQLKGKADSLAAARVLGLTRETTTARSATTPFIGRQAELGALLAAVESVRDGRGSNFAIRADAGGGKTRLVKELRTRLAQDVRWLEGRAYAYSQRTPFFLIIDLLNRAFDIDEDDSREAMIRKLEGGITALLPEAKDVLPVIGSLYEVPLGDGTKVDKEDFVPRLTEAVRGLLQAGAEKNPTIACLQDLHWADDSSVLMIRELLAAASAPLPETHDAQYDARLYLAIAQLTAGNFERGRALRTELLERVERTGQQRAAPAAFFVGAYDAALRLDFEAVDRESEAGLAIVKDPLYRGWLLGYLAISQFSRGLYEEACRTADAHLAHHDGRPAEFCLTVSRFYQGLKGLVQGNLGQGMQACQTELERGRSAGQRWTALQSNLGLAEVYTSMAAREIAPDLGALLRNPGFVAAPGTRAVATSRSRGVNGC